MNIRIADREDFPALIRLIDALADYEKLPRPDAEARERLQRHGWPTDGSAPLFTAWLAETEATEDEPSNAVAYAITFKTYSSFLARPTLYIEDIFVLTTHRRKSVGSALMQRLIQHANDQKCGRMEWVVLDWNTTAQDFYRKLGAQHLSEWHHYRLTMP